ncbi:hypothetical protein ANTRET_LOCUS6938 [Anthophora retusa]
MADSYLRDRRLVYNTTGGVKEILVTGGAAQGSVLGPDLWYAFYDSLLRLEMPEETVLIGYADDVAAFVAARTVEQAQRNLNRTMVRVNAWMEGHGLSLALNRTEIVILTKRSESPRNLVSKETKAKAQKPKSQKAKKPKSQKAPWHHRQSVAPTRRINTILPMRVDDITIQTKSSARYFGVSVDTKLNFGEHIRLTADKAEKGVTALSRLMVNSSGPRASKRRLLMSLVTTWQRCNAVPSKCASRKNEKTVTEPTTPGLDGAFDVASPSNVARVAVRIPPFWEKNPTLWFRQVESQFALSGITQDATKYHYVSANLENRYADVVGDIISNPPASEMYETIKSELIRQLSDSKEQNIRYLLENEEIGDRKPSMFLRRLQTLAGDAVSDDFLKTLWMSRLPTSVQTVLITRKKDSLSDLAALADAVMEVTPRSQVAAASAGRIDDTRAYIAEVIRREIAALRIGTESRRLRSKLRNRRERRSSRSRNRDNDVPPGDGRCWYHWKYGSDAKRCREPCTQAAGNQWADR